MTSFDSDGVEIAYIDEGEGEPLLLIHGFASNVAANWVDPGWVRTLTQSGRRVIAYDNRGHGRSEKLYDPDVYGAPLMAEDGRRLLDHLGITRADVLGYSMGARIAAFLTLAHPERVRSLILGGLGINMVRGVVGSGPDRQGARGPAHRGRHQRYGAELQGLCRADQERSQGACRLYQGAAGEDHAGAARDHRRADAYRRG